MASLNFRPLYDRILVEREEEETTTAGGIVLPDAAKEKPIKGVIKAAGNGKLLNSGKTCALTVKVGDKILFGKYAGTEVKLEGKTLVIMREEDIMGVIS